MTQTLLTALIVLASAGYAFWSLMPAAWRRVVLVRWLGRPVPPSSGGCGGCGSGCAPSAPATPQAQPITLHRRPPAA